VYAAVAPGSEKKPHAPKPRKEKAPRPAPIAAAAAAAGGMGVQTVAGMVVPGIGPMVRLIFAALG
jgi:hypothetical protein